MVNSYNIPIETVDWFRADMDRRIQFDDYEVRTFSSEIIKELYGLKDTDLQEYRWVIDEDDPAKKKLAEIIYQFLPKNVWFYAAYQRQFIPHACHVDEVLYNYDPKTAFTGVIPLVNNIDNICKTIVWNKNFITNEEFKKFNSEEFTPSNTVDQISSTYDIEHCLFGPNKRYDYLELDGVYDYEYGTLGLFTRTHVHCSTNWKKYNSIPYKDIIILHCG